MQRNGTSTVQVLGNNGGQRTGQESSNILEHELWDVRARHVRLKKGTGKAEMRGIKIRQERN
jgi:hypothetical protein